jgi:hypothetical protein
VQAPFFDWGTARLVFCTNFLVQSYEVPVPKMLWVEIVGNAPDLSWATSAFVGFAAEITSIIALCANAAMGHIEPELAYDANPDTVEHEFIQSFLPEWPLAPVPGRRIDTDSVKAILASLGAHNERPRLTRAIAQYSEALGFWGPGREISCIAHLYMGVEALTKAALRQYTSQDGRSEDQLAADWRVERKALENEVRRRLIFAGDDDCFKKAKAASDAFEHGYWDYDTIRKPAKEVLLQTAGHLRRAILTVMGVEENIKTGLLSKDYTVPRGPVSLIYYLRGKMIGKIEELAAKDQQYPYCEWRPTLKTVSFGENGLYEFGSEHMVTMNIGERAQFRPERYEIWDGSTIRDVRGEVRGDGPPPRPITPLILPARKPRALFRGLRRPALAAVWRQIESRVPWPPGRKRRAQDRKGD